MWCHRAAARAWLHYGRCRFGSVAHTGHSTQRLSGHGTWSQRLYRQCARNYLRHTTDLSRDYNRSCGNLLLGRCG